MTQSIPMNQLLDRILRQQALLREPENLPEGRICRLRADWEREVLNAAPGTKTVNTPLGLEEALRDTSLASILIPADSVLTEDLIYRMLRRWGDGGKTIFRVIEAEA